MRWTSVAILAVGVLAAANAAARRKQVPPAPPPPAVVLFAIAAPPLDPAAAEPVERRACEELAAAGLPCLERTGLPTPEDPPGRPGPEMLRRTLDSLDLPFGVAVVLYPGADPDTIEADIYLQVADRDTGLYRSALADADDAAEVVAEAVAELVGDTAARLAHASENGGLVFPLLPTDEGEDDGVIDLTINLTLQGILAAYTSCTAAGVTDWQVIGPTLLMGGGTGLAGALLADYYLDISQAQAATVGAGGWWGYLEGTLLAQIVGAGNWEETSPWAVGGWAVGLATGITLASTLDFNKGDTALVNSAVGWGAFAGAVLGGTILGRDVFTTSTDYDFALPFAGLNLGLGAGILTANYVEISRGRMALIDLAGLLGVLLGGSVGTPLIVDDPSDDDKRGYSAIVLGSAALGIGLGALFTEDLDAVDDAPIGEAVVQVEPSGDVSLQVPVPRPWYPPPSLVASPQSALVPGVWVGIAEGTW